MTLDDIKQTTLPSAHQVDDTVMYTPYNYHVDGVVIEIMATVIGVTFTQSKVFYDLTFDLEGKSFEQIRVDSSFVNKVETDKVH